MTKIGKKLIIEQIDRHSLDYLTEEVAPGKKIYKIRGPFLQSEIKNRNGRVYGKNTLLREVTRYQTDIREGDAVGELDHPPTPTINCDRISHKITSLNEDGNNWIGEAVILDTPMGKIAQALIEGGVRLGMSTRGLGTLNGDKVNDDFYLVTAGDIVKTPSGPDCYVNGIQESITYFVDGHNVVERAVEDFTAKINKHGSKVIMEAVTQFLNQVKTNL